jgi:hypothetical protein
MEIDSRQYAFSYLIRSPEEVPGDFPVPEFARYRIVLFLPRDDPDWFGRRAYPPRILLLDQDAIVVLTHPLYGEPPVRLALADVLYYEIGQVLLIGWMRFVTTGPETRLPFNTRSDRLVNEFLDELGHRYLASRMECASEPKVEFGLPLDIKFRNCLAMAIGPGERVCATWFNPPVRKFRRWGPFRVRAETGGDLAAVTDRRVLWITDQCKDRYERYASIVSSTPIRRVIHTEVRENALLIQLHASVFWSIPVPAGRCAETEAFARFIQETLQRRRSAEAQT